MSAPLEAVAAAEWAVFAMAARAIFGRAFEPDELAELRVSVTPSALPGLAGIEWEFIDKSGLVLAGGAL